MKKKFLAIVSVVIMAVTCAFMFVACGNSEIDGTYYVFERGTMIEDSTIVFDSGKVTVNSSEEGTTYSFSGKYTVSGDTVTMVFTEGDDSMTQEATIVSSGVLKLSDRVYYCKYGKTPPIED